MPSRCNSASARGNGFPCNRAAGDTELYQVTASIPADTSVRIVASPPGGGNTYWTIVDYVPERK